MEADAAVAVYSIGAVARMLGVPTSTLRAWEARYALITPVRSSGSRRLYTRAQVEHLRMIKAQIQLGFRASDAHRVVSAEIANGTSPRDTAIVREESGVTS